MDHQLRVEAVEAAQSLLQHYKAARPEWISDRTPVDDIAAWLGLSVETFHPDDYPPGTYGFLEPGENLVWLCRNLAETLRRFTLAHELGHVILHAHSPHSPIMPASQSFLEIVSEASREDPCLTRDIREEAANLAYQEQAEELLGPGVVYDPRSQRELAANLFAAELLMPIARVRDLYLYEPAQPAAGLASIFDVSQAAMLNRLANLLTEPRQPEVSPGPAQPAATDSAQPAQPAPAPRKSYDEFQQAAIEAPTPALIVAGPGSGKTSTLIGRVEYLIQAQNVQPRHILALTFSRKAAAEMQERLQKVLDPGMVLPTVSTFHAFCAELLRTYGQLVGLRQDFAFVDGAEGYFLLRRLAETLPLYHYQNLSNPAAHFPAFLSAISRAKDELVTPAQYRALAEHMREQARDDETLQEAEKAREIAEIYAVYQQGLERQGDTDFGGLIMQTVQLLQEHPEVQNELEQKYQHILVDEFQDINRASGILLRLLAGSQRRVWVVGDANQAIYSFRGASPANIANFRDDYPDAVILPLSRNYRSRPDIVNLADTFRRELLEPATAPGSVQTARPTHSDSYITLVVAADESSELHGLVADIQRRLASGYTFRDIVVLCRTRALARKITSALALAGLPVIERGGMLEQEHIKDLLSILMLLAEPGGMGILRAAHLTAHPFAQRDIEALLLAAREQQCSLYTLILRGEAPLAMSAAGSLSLSRLSGILKTLQHPTANVWSMLAQYLLLETSLVRDLLVARDDQKAENVLADYAGLLRLARAYDQQQQALRQQREQEVQAAVERGEEPQSLPPPPSMQEQAQGFLEYLNILLTLRQDGSSQREASEADGEEGPNIIRVMTVHASKGLEFPVVYLPGLAQRRFPLQRRASPVTPPAGMLPPESESAAAHESGEACLFYVGATRARDQLILSYSERYGKQASKRSSYVDALVVGVPDERIMRVYWKDGVSTQSQPEVGEDTRPSSQPSTSFIEAVRPLRLKASHLEDYQTCPRRYAYSTIYGFQLEESAFLRFWQATRDTLAELSQKLATGQENGNGEQPLTQEQAREIYSRYWREHGGHAFPFAPLYEQHGHEITAHILRSLSEGNSANWQLRRNLTVDIAGRSIDVSIDRVEASTQSETPTKFVRARFGKRKTKPTPGTRELLYVHAHRQHHPGQTVELHAHNMSTGESYEIKLSSKKEQSLLDDLEQAMLGIERNDFTPRPDPFVCPTCPFFLICPA